MHRLWIIIGAAGGIAALAAGMLSGCEFCTHPPAPEGALEGEGNVTDEGEGSVVPEGQPEGKPEGQVEGEGEGEAPAECAGDCTYEIINVYPHDPEAFTQGLQYADGILYEGTGYWEQSSLRKVILDTGFVMHQVPIPASFQGQNYGRVFGEGITLAGNRIIQLTWKNKVAFVYDKDSLEVVQTFSYATEGWGLTSDGSRLIMSDGTSMLYFRNPETFEVIGTITARDDGYPITRLNELEYIGGLIYANVWQTDTIAKINPETGAVVGWVYLSGLLTREERRNADVLNGIAYDEENGRLFVTGKYWPKLFEIRLVPKP